MVEYQPPCRLDDSFLCISVFDRLVYSMCEEKYIVFLHRAQWYGKMYSKMALVLGLFHENMNLFVLYHMRMGNPRRGNAGL